jgi:hypothetical protein
MISLGPLISVGVAGFESTTSSSRSNPGALTTGSELLGRCSAVRHSAFHRPGAMVLSPAVAETAWAVSGPPQVPRDHLWVRSADGGAEPAAGRNTARAGAGSAPGGAVAQPGALDPQRRLLLSGATGATGAMAPGAADADG